MSVDADADVDIDMDVDAKGSRIVLPLLHRGKLIMLSLMKFLNTLDKIILWIKYMIKDPHIKLYLPIKKKGNGVNVKVTTSHLRVKTT